MKYMFILLSSLVLLACNQGAQSPRGFSLPEGDSENGRAVFAKYQCQDCHRIAGQDAPEEATYIIAKPIVLGGTSARIKTYGELVTSIINPSHKLTPRQPLSLTSKNGESLMRVVNDELTVAELVDLVAYLQPLYKVMPYRTSDYRLYELRIPEQEN